MAHRDQESAQHIVGALLILMIAAGIGAIRHGFGPLIPGETYAIARTANYLFIMMGGTLLVLGVMRSEMLEPDIREFWQRMWHMKVLMLGTFYIIEPRQGIVAGDWATNMIMLVVLSRSGLRWRDHPQSTHLCKGTLLAILAGIAQHFVQWGTLNNDLCHLIMIPAVYEFHRAAILVRDCQRPDQ